MGRWAQERKGEDAWSQGRAQLRGSPAVSDTVSTLKQKRDLPSRGQLVWLVPGWLPDCTQGQAVSRDLRGTCHSPDPANVDGNFLLRENRNCSLAVGPLGASDSPCEALNSPKHLSAETPAGPGMKAAGAAQHSREPWGWATSLVDGANALPLSGCLARRPLLGSG